MAMGIEHRAQRICPHTRPQMAVGLHIGTLLGMGQCIAMMRQIRPDGRSQQRQHICRCALQHLKPERHMTPDNATVVYAIAMLQVS